MDVPLDQKYLTDKNVADKIPALDPRWMQRVQFVMYQPPPVDMDDGAAREEWMERAAFLEQDLQLLLQMPHNKFWCQVVFDETLHRCIDSYLRFAPRSYDVVYKLPERMREIHNRLHRLVFIACLRMATYKESKRDHISPQVFGDILYENYIFDIPKLLDLCVLYGADNGSLLSKMINNIFTQQPKYQGDLENIVPTIIQVFESIAKKCGLQPDSVPSSPQKIDAPDVGKPNLITMPITQLQDVIFYLADTAHTLSRFLEVYPKASKAFMLQDFPLRMCHISESVVGALSTALAERDWKASGLKPLLKRKLHAAQVALAQVFHHIVFNNTMQPLLESSGSTEEKERYVETYIHLMSSVLAERRFLSLYEALFPFAEDRDLLSQFHQSVDETRLQFIQEGIEEAFAAHGRSKEAHAARTARKTAAAASAAAFREEDLGAGVAAAADYGTEEEAQGACARRLKGVELDSLVSSISDLLPDLGHGFIELCLEEMDYDAERVINCVLEDKLPPSLQDMDKTMEREKPPAETEESLVEQRRNIYDNDEFDVFSAEAVDTSKIHKGKKEKLEGGMSNLEDKSELADFKPMFERYGSQYVESMYEKAVEYEDEYDDTYDSNLIGADDADSADELTSKKVLAVPRVLGHEAPKEESEGTTTNTSTNDEDDSQDSSSEEDRPPRDEFVQDPAKLRQIREQRQAAKAAREGKNRAGQGQRPQKKFDVEGSQKGQGQSSDVLRNRKKKEQNKASRVHHNRKALSDKKRKM